MDDTHEKFQLIRHSKRVAELSYLLALKLSIEEEEAQLIYIAGFVHDVGKMLIEDAVINKKDALNDGEMAIIRKHVDLGVNIVRMYSPDSRVVNIISQHHENVDGSGYPNRLVGNEILMGAKILSVCDTFDALTTERVYRKAYSQREAIHIMKKEVKRFDSRVFFCFIKLLNEVNLGTDWLFEMENNIKHIIK